MRNSRTQRIVFFLAPKIVPWLIRLLGWTMRVTVRDPENALRDYIHKPVLVAFWHNRIIMMPYFYRRYFKNKLPGKVMISPSRDGQFITDVIKSFRIGTFRGSSSKRGVSAMREMAREICETEMVLAITPDGPRGPIYQVQPGILYLAAHSGWTILPVSYRLKWRRTLNSWDKTQIPLPFTSCELIVGKPMQVDANDDLEVAAQELTRRLGQ